MKKIKKKVKLYIITTYFEKEYYIICDEKTDEVYASTSKQDLAVFIKNSIERYTNQTN